MSVGSTAKQVAIVTGLYRPARWVARRLRPARYQTYRDNVELYRTLLLPGALCFDVGANIGEKSEALLAAHGRVVAFEPNPRVIPELRARCGHHPNWDLVIAGLGSGAGIATLHARAASGQSSFEQDWEGQVIGIHHVPVVTLDAAIHRFGRPDYCKIDVEGWELQVLQGLSQPLPLLSIEFHITEKDVCRTRCCLIRLLELGSAHVRVNVTQGEKPALQFPRWMQLDRFLSWFPDDLRGYGDIFVRMTAGD